MSFMVGGGCDITKVYVELLVDGEASHHTDSYISLEQVYDRHQANTVVITTRHCEQRVSATKLWSGFTKSDPISRTQRRVRIVDNPAPGGPTSMWMISVSAGSMSRLKCRIQASIGQTCGEGQCGVHAGPDAGAAYIFRRRSRQ